MTEHPEFDLPALILAMEEIRDRPQDFSIEHIASVMDNALIAVAEFASLQERIILDDSLEVETDVDLNKIKANDAGGVTGFLAELEAAHSKISTMSAERRRDLLTKSVFVIDDLRRKASAVARSQAWNTGDIVARLRSASRRVSQMREADVAALFLQSYTEVSILNGAWTNRVERAIVDSEKPRIPEDGI